MEVQGTYKAIMDCQTLAINSLVIGRILSRVKQGEALIK